MDGAGGILVVCDANICRSPMAEFAIRRRFALVPGLELVRVASAGMRAHDEQAPCEAVATFHSEPAWQAMAAEHRSHRLQLDQVRDAALIVTATRAVRSAIVTAIPERRRAVFTLLEAVWLGRGYVPSPKAQPSVRGFCEHIDRLRGLRPAPHQPRQLPWRRERQHPFDVPDGHCARPVVHAASMRAVHGAGGELAAIIVGGPR